MERILHKLISTWMLCGMVKKMPGTVGSLASFPLIPVILSNEILGIATILFLFLVGMWSTDNYTKDYCTSHDPKEVVIDEVVGQLLTILLSAILLRSVVPILFNVEFAIQEQKRNYLFLLLCFFFFRVFDIMKTWPINLIDKNIKSALGVMLDDVAAALLACVFVLVVFCLMCKIGSIIQV